MGGLGGILHVSGYLHFELRICCIHLKNLKIETLYKLSNFFKFTSSAGLLLKNKKKSQFFFSSSPNIYSVMHIFIYKKRGLFRNDVPC